MKYQFSKVTLGSLLVFALSFWILYMAGPRSVASSVAEVVVSLPTKQSHIPAGDRTTSVVGYSYENEAVISGHRFQCQGVDAQTTIVNCQTQLLGESLSLKFRFPSVNAREVCEGTFGSQPFVCQVNYDYRARLPFVRITSELGFESQQLWQIRLENPLINIREGTWGQILWWLAAGWALLLAVAAYSQFWPKVLRNRLANVVVPTLLAAVLFVPTAWFTILALLFTGYVD